MSPRERCVLYAVIALAALAAGAVLYRLVAQFQVAIPAAASQNVKPARTAQASIALLTASLPDLTGRAQRLEQWKGKVLVVNFWATWCAPCREEIPALVRVQNELGAQGVQIIGIAIDEAQKVKPYAHEMQINYPILIGELDAIDLAREAGNRFGALPFTVVLDRSGKIVEVELGKVDRQKLIRALRAIL